MLIRTLASTLAMPVQFVMPVVSGESELSFKIEAVRGAQKESKMRYAKILGFVAVLAIALMIPAASTQAQVRVGVAVGPVAVGVGPAYVGAPPVCAYGYYSYPPYACAPYGYYGPDWFVGGVFIGAGPWYHGYWGHPGYWGHSGFYGRPGFYGRGPVGGFHGGPAVHGGFQGGGGFHGGGSFHGGGGFHGGGRR